MAAHTHTTTTLQPTKAAPYRSAPMPETVMDIMNRIGAILEARQRASITADMGIPVSPHRRALPVPVGVSAPKGVNVVDLAAYRKARA